MYLFILLSKTLNSIKKVLISAVDHLSDSEYALIVLFVVFSFKQD